MNDAKRKKLEAAGFRVGDAEDFLELSPEERQLVELRVRIGRFIRTRREEQNLTQKELADRIKTTQPRVVLLESGTGVSLDAEFLAYFALGGKIEHLTLALPKSGPSSKRVKSPTNLKAGRKVQTKRTRVSAK